MKLSRKITAMLLSAALLSGGASAYAEDVPSGQAASEDAAVEQSIEAAKVKEIEAKDADKITVKINGKEIDFSQYGDVSPYIENGFTLIPIRAVAEALGLEAEWNNDERKVVLKGGVEIEIPIDSEYAEVNGEKVKLDVSAHIINDRAFVPLRFVSESMGADVSWDQETKTADIRGGSEMNGQMNEQPGRGESDRRGMQGGEQAAVTDPEIQKVLDENADRFEQFTFEDEESGISLEYSLYIPADYDENERYPLIMYIPDSTGSGKSARQLVEQYYGADIWVTEEEQSKHASFVLVPAFSGVVVDDNWNTSEQIETAVKLINHLIDTYSIDTGRLYTTGQSMGCMTSLHLNSKYPDLFAASLFVSGQWDISVLKCLETKKFFYITAGGDAKASGGQDEVKAMFDADGVGYSYGTWSAQDSAEAQNDAVAELLEQGCDANMIRFETGSVLKDGSGMEHMSSFNYAYKISAVRDWLFEQSK